MYYIYIYVHLRYFITVCDPYKEPYFSFEETEAQRSEMTCPRPFQHNLGTTQLLRPKFFPRELSASANSAEQEGRTDSMDPWAVYSHILSHPLLDQGLESATSCCVCSALWVISGLWNNPTGRFSYTGCLASLGERINPPNSPW